MSISRTVAFGRSVGIKVSYSAHSAAPTTRYATPAAGDDDEEEEDEEEEGGHPVTFVILLLLLPPLELEPSSAASDASETPTMHSKRATNL